MLKYSLEELQQRFEDVKKLIESLEDDYEKKTIELENDLYDELEFLKDGYNDNFENDSKKLDKIVRKYEVIKRELEQLKEDNYFFNTGNEYDRMYPNRNDDGFDEVM
jgi:hypothetical protein